MKIVKTVCLVVLVLLSASVLPAQNKDCVCPTIEITEPTGVVQEGAPMTFSSKIEGIEESFPVFKWSIDKGVLLKGQGTRTIVVDTKGLGDTVVTATLEVFVGCDSCDARASGSGVVVSEPKPVLVDQFQHSNCEEILSRTDAFLMQLSSGPSSTGYIIIHGTPNASRIAERIFRNWFGMRRDHDRRLVFVKAPGPRRAEIDFWILPAGGNASLIKSREGIEIETDPGPEEQTEPFIFTSEFADEIGGCSLYDPEAYAVKVLENPKSRGNIVIYQTSQKLFRESEKEILEKLVGFGIDRKRLRTFFVRVSSKEPREGIELWFLP